MSEPAKAFIQVAPDSTGKRVRNLVVTDVVDGVEVQTYMQIVAVADREGRLLMSAEDWQAAMLVQATKTNELLTLILEALS